MAANAMSKLLSDSAIKGAKLGNIGKMCRDCAFKKGSDANTNDHMAVELAAGCLCTGKMFNCHTADFKNADKPCIGYLYAKQYFDSLENDG